MSFADQWRFQKLFSLRFALAGALLIERYYRFVLQKALYMSRLMTAKTPIIRPNCAAFERVFEDCFEK